MALGMIGSGNTSAGRFKQPGAIGWNPNRKTTEIVKQPVGTFRGMDTGYGGNGIMSAINNVQSGSARSAVSGALNPTPAPQQPQSGFSYNPQSDPAYQAAVRQAQANAATASGNAEAEMNRRGILNSTITGDRVAQIQQAEMGRVSDTILPQLMQQAYQRYNDGQQLALQQGQLTGYYQSPEMKQQYYIVNQAKQDYANAKTPEERIAAHQRADAARGLIEQQGGNAGLVGANVTAAQAGANQGKYGIETMAHQQQMYNQSADNPANQAQVISNKIDQLKLDNLPQQMKLDLEQLQQQVNSGKIDLKTAEYNYKELTDPNSITNRIKKMQFEMSQFNASNDKTKSNLEVQKLQKQIAQIGKTPPKSDYEAKMNEIKLETAEEKLKQLKNGKPGTSSSKSQVDQDYKDDYSSFVADPSGAYSWISDPDNAKSVIDKYGTSRYQELLKLVTPKG